MFFFYFVCVCVFWWMCGCPSLGPGNMNTDGNGFLQVIGHCVLNCGLVVEDMHHPGHKGHFDLVCNKMLVMYNVNNEV